jgi:GAF domain-containing protein
MTITSMSGVRVPDSGEKRRLYAEARERIVRLTCGEHDAVARMASVVAVLHGMMPHFYWTGFYRVVGSELVIGPYQGTPGCLRIAFGRGVCGTAWAAGETLVVPEVSAFAGHIACDARAASEIVVPVRGRAGEVLAVLDVDSTVRGAFDGVDKQGLEDLLDSVFGGG